jgi:hypothetical protein
MKNEKIKTAVFYNEQKLVMHMESFEVQILNCALILKNGQILRKMVQNRKDV